MMCTIRVLDVCGHEKSAPRSEERFLIVSRNYLQEYDLLADDACATDDKAAGSAQLLHIGIGEHGLDAGL